jgi:hypothetical protein
MGINTTIFEGIRHNTYDYGFASWNVEEFLTIPSDFLTRQSKAIDIIEGIMTAHGKQKLLRHVVQLAKVEHGIRELEPWVRDHVVHALLSFLLGVFVNERLLKPGGQTIGAFQWKLAGLFHDVGYPAQVAKDILKPYTDQINNIKRDLCVARPDVFFRVVPVGLDQLANGVNGLDLIQEWLDVWGLRISAIEEYTRMVDSGGVCHGMISSLSVLYVVDLMYQKYNPRRAYVDIHDPPSINWNQSCFENDVVPACAAVFVHNLPTRCFRSAPLDRTRAALPFLLRLSDCLQDWDRPSASDPAGISDDAFDISAVPGRVVFTVTDPGRRDRIAEEIVSALVAPDIEVV